MTMDLKPLFEMQRKLDEHINELHPVQMGEDRLSKKILAFQVELGELANECPDVFKFWSNKKRNQEKALAEYVDGLHFALSIALDKQNTDLDITEIDVDSNIHDNIETQFTWLYHTSTDIFLDKYKMFNHVRMLFLEFLALGKMLGFTWGEVFAAYMEKNKVNHTRQENGY